MFSKLECLSLMANVDLNNANEQNQTSLHETYLNLIPYPFYQNILKYFNHFLNWCFSTKVNPNNGSETKWGIFPWNIFKSDTKSFFIKSCQSISMFSKSKFLNFMTKVDQNNVNETKSDVFSWDIFKSDTFLWKYIQVYQWL